MLKFIIIALVLYFGYLASQWDPSEFRQNTINTLQGEKTINAVNSSRANVEKDVNTAAGR